MIWIDVAKEASFPMSSSRKLSALWACQSSPHHTGLKTRVQKVWVQESPMKRKRMDRQSSRLGSGPPCLHLFVTGWITVGLSDIGLGLRWVQVIRKLRNLWIWWPVCETQTLRHSLGSQEAPCTPTALPPGMRNCSLCPGIRRVVLSSCLATASLLGC